MGSRVAFRTSCINSIYKLRGATFTDKNPKFVWIPTRVNCLNITTETANYGLAEQNASQGRNR